MKKIYHNPHEPNILTHSPPLNPCDYSAIGNRSQGHYYYSVSCAPKWRDYDIEEVKKSKGERAKIFLHESGSWFKKRFT